ncbi:hypothetical protein [uncultured Adlercreutzia sp.]|uniref:hypothetical protein n=1 Tax=uncultured Adlercreutzia sp. TaxID=875803 RepID=UPI0026F3D6E1|nr:hypothetical protein [uncultured Adlercreutzia sp.]
MTNWEKYFSEPWKAAEMQIEWGTAGQLTKPHDWFVIRRFDIDEMDHPEEVAFVPAEYENPAPLYEWMISRA